MRVREFASALEAAEYYVSLGWQPIAGRPAGKIPLNKDWKTAPWKEGVELARFNENGSANIGLLLGKTCVDVDLDTPNARRYAPLLLPPTLLLKKDGMVTHYLYDMPVGHEPIHTKQFTLPSNKMSCEMRGTDGSDVSQYTMVGPSTHPSGAKVELLGDAPAVITSGEWLFRQVRLIATCDFLTPYWSDGSRNNLTLGLSGFLAKNHYDEETILSVVEALGEITGDTEDRSAQVRSTVAKLESGGRVAGEQTLRQHLPADAFEALKRWYSDQVTRLEDYEIDEIDALPLEQRLPYLTYVIDADVFTTDGSHLKSNQIPIIFGNAASQKDIRQAMLKCNNVKSFGYFPNKELIVKAGVENYWNNWRPSTLAPAEGNIDPFLEHVSSLCDGEQESISTLLGFMSHAVKKPEEKVRWMPILIGGQGSGKSTLCDIMGRLVGMHNYSAIAAADMLGNWTSLLENKLLVAIEEMRISHSTQTKALANALKEKVTNDKVTVKRKYINEYQIDNVTRFIGLSNHLVPIEIEASDRRYYVIVSANAVRNSGVTVSDSTKGWIVGYHDWLYFNGGLEAILHFLLEYDTHLFTPNKAPLQSDRQKKFKESIQETTTSPDRAEEAAEALQYLSMNHPICEIQTIRNYMTREQGISNASNRLVNAVLDHYGYRRFSITKNEAGKPTKRYSLCLLSTEKEFSIMSDRELLDAYLKHIESEF